MTYSLTHALTPGATENITDVKENIEDGVGDALGSYRTLVTSTAAFAVNAAADTYILGTHNASDSRPHTSGSNIGATSTDPAPSLLYLDNADYDVGGLTTNLRVRAQVAANATAPAINFTVGLYPVTVAGGADVIAFTLGTVTSGSTVLFTIPGASTVSQANSGDFAIPADGAYVLGVVTSGTLANNSYAIVSAQLQLHLS